MSTVVIYKSQTGFTEKYAKLIGARLDAEVLTLKDAKKKPEDFFENADAIICGGWAMAGKMVGSEWYIPKLNEWKGKRIALFCVGASPAEAPDVDVNLDRILDDEQKKIAKVFYCQGGINYDKMKLPSKLAMKMLASATKNSKKQEEREMSEMIAHSYDISDEKFIEPIINYITENNEM